MIDLTIGIATLNRPVYLREALESVFKSASLTAQSLEVIVSDQSCSVENASVEKWAVSSKPENVELIWLRSSNVKSGIENWNRCLQRATGKFYLMIGDDDRIERTAISMLLKKISLATDDLSMILGSYRDIDETGRTIRERRHCDQEYRGEDFLSRIVMRMNGLRWCSVVIRLNVLQATNPFSYPFPGGGGAADGAAIISAVQSGRVWCISEIIGEFRVHSSNDSRSLNEAYQVKQREVLTQFLGELPKESNRIHNLTVLWLASGITFQSARWVLSARRTRGERLFLAQHFAEYSAKVNFQKLKFSEKIFFIISWCGFRSLMAVSWLLERFPDENKRS